jgi:outer membrane lipoprotein carrier protein
MHRYLLVFLLLLPRPARADEAQDLVKKVQRVYDNVPSFSADFEQATLSKMFGGAQQAAGKVVFKKPGKMRWTYLSPVTQEIISDGKSFWFYAPADKQVQVGDAGGFLKNRASITFLAGKGQLSAEFNVAIGKAPEGAAPGTVLELTPKVEDPTAAKVLLIVDPKTGLVNETWVFDFAKNATRVRFTNADTKRKLKDDLFTFQVPPGVDIVKMPGTK